MLHTVFVIIFVLQTLSLSINSPETIASHYGYLSFKPYFPGNHLLIRSDNKTAIAFINDMGGMSSQIRDDDARKLWQSGSESGIWISAHSGQRPYFYTHTNDSGQVVVSQIALRNWCVARFGTEYHPEGRGVKAGIQNVC